MQLKDLKKGDYFTLKPIEYPTEKQVFVRGEYSRESKKYNVVHFDDINHERLLKGETTVYTDFIF